METKGKVYRIGTAEFTEKLGTPRRTEAGDILDYGYIVELFRANGYWSIPSGLNINGYASLEDARNAAEGHDARVRSQEIVPAEGRPGTPKRYRITNRVDTYVDGSSYQSEVRRWAWHDDTGFVVYDMQNGTFGEVTGHPSAGGKH